MRCPSKTICRQLKRGHEWHAMGVIDLGPLINHLDELSHVGNELEVATHYFQYIFVGFNGFRWPVAYYGSNNVNGHGIYLTFWQLVDALSSYGFKVHTALMDSSSNNRQFCCTVVKPESAHILKYVALNPYDHTTNVSIAQDCKHVIKKIRNSVMSSRPYKKVKRQLMLNGQYIFWDHFEQVYAFNCLNSLRIYRKLTKEHIEVTASDKMRNHLAINVLNADMLNLMRLYQKSLPDQSVLNATIELLEHTSVFIDIFCQGQTKIHSMNDPHIGKLLSVLHFLQKWEDEYKTHDKK